MAISARDLPIEIRGARRNDIPGLCQLLADLFAAAADFHPDAERQRRALSLILDSPEVGRIYCAVQAGAVVGMASILFTVSTAEGGRAAWLEDMVVRADRRRMGIGRRLLDHVVGEGRAAGCTRITLLTDAVNCRAMRFYASAGFVGSTMTPLRLRMEEQPGAAARGI
jgi:GNAT superfamily N-acetyltransferase